MGCVSAKKQNNIQKKIRARSQQPSIDMDDNPSNSAAQSPAFQKIVQMGALTPDEVRDYVKERRNFSSCERRVEYIRKQSGRYTPTIIYKYKGSQSTTNTPSKATNIQPIIYRIDLVSK